ncbi:DUF3737 family protein [Xylocopilactobacillus apis]|uniref:DUF3737 domain-containing protein n=1 Tax=Xylocopilactobacillus apis TaxID=2932183 RepID=A0AAU9DLH1_9LACO|nr:DUF3737 family protein [Xylocopilactobacillus apis]BDR56419.1 hypothetical protein KIMC2_09810 [Xylocopilactobacillus apis]
MTTYQEKTYTGERSLFGVKNAMIQNVTFGMGESPLKESSHLSISNTIFKWKYPLWYSSDVKVNHSIFEKMSRSGIWYTNDIKVTNSTLEAPKLFRRCRNVDLENVYFADAAETIWNCDQINVKDVQARGDYFGMNSKEIVLDNFQLVGNYAFDGASNIEAHNCTFMSKDAFWNCKNVKLENCTINGEYLSWNTENLTLINCTIESNQGLCYIKHLKMRNCSLLETDLAFEYCSDIDAEIVSDIISVKNPISGVIKANHINEIIQDDKELDSSKIKFIQKEER